MEDWNNLFEHALISDASPDFQQWLHHRSGWQWQPPPEQADHPEEALVGGLCHPCRLSLKLELSQPLKLDLSNSQTTSLMTQPNWHMFDVVR